MHREMLLPLSMRHNILMRRVARIVLFLFVMFLPASPVIATPVVHNESRLAVYTHGFKVGEIISRYSRGDDGGHDMVRFTSHTRINDFTTMDCPELRIKAEGESLTVRILDLELCEVVMRSYRWVKSERVTLNGVADHFRVVEFHDLNKAGTRWILPDMVGVRIARQDGKTRNGAYSVRAIDSAK